MQNHYFDSDTSISMDTCAINQRNLDNDSIMDYNLFNYFQPNELCQDHLKKVVATSTSFPNLTTKIGYGVASCFIDEDSKARFDTEQTHGPERQQLHVRPFGAVPDLSRGACLPNAGLEDVVVQGSLRQRQCDILSEYDFNRNVPFNACMNSFVNNRSMALPDVYSIGENSRDMIKGCRLNPQ